MKSFLIALTLLALLLTGTLLNCRYLDQVTGELLALEASFPTKYDNEKSSPDPTIDRARELWKQSQFYLEIGANMRHINAISASLDSVANHYANGSVADYLAARHQLIEALRSLRHADALTLRSII